MERMLENYYKIEEGYETIANEDGFCAYRYNDSNNFFYIGHFYAEKSYDFFEHVKNIAKEKGAKFLVGDLFLNDFNSDSYTKKLKVHIGHGYKIVDVNNKCITVMKEI
jgi:purine-nucleoside phosphorylase